MTHAHRFAPASLLAALTFALTGCGGNFGTMVNQESIGLFGLIHLGLCVYAFIQIFKSSATTGSKVIWALIVFFFPLVGLIVWFIAGPKAR
ncbi:MAG: PLD nuclease N-terminal domain-containing protein [Rubricoccaceae bacterium]